MIIAIDGPAGTGKSTIAKLVAHALHFEHFDTGAMYRAFTWWLMHQSIDPDDEGAVEKAITSFDFDIETQGDDKRYFAHGHDVTSAIRSLKVTELVSKVAAIHYVRAHLVKIQKRFAEKNNAVFEGRDMGTVVFPHAELKIFLTASPEVRAERRLAQLKEKDPKATTSLESVLEEINARDRADSTRHNSPLAQADDAKVIDTSNLSITEVIEEVIHLWSLHAPAEKSRLFYRVCKGIVYGLIKLFYRHRVTGIQRVPRGAAIFASNHVSFLDPPIIGSSCPFPVHFFARASLFNGALLRFFISRLNTHPLQYGDHELAAMKMACHLLEEGKKIILFPEGERSFNGQLKELKPGAARIALRTKAPIVPVYLEGVFKVWPRTRSLPRLFGKTRCHFGSPLYPSNYAHLPKKEATEKLNQDLMEALCALRTQ